MIRLHIKQLSKQFTQVGILFAIVLSLAATFGFSTVSANGPAQDPETAKFETDFMQTMIDHHNMASEMAKVCLQKATHDELRTMCQNIIDSQTKEIQEMQSWLASWYQIDHQPMMMQNNQQMMNELNAASGADFEMMFLKMMIEHHTTAIQEATPCVQRAEHQELKDLCQNIITSQQKEIDQMQTWLAQWYNVSASAAQATPAAGSSATPEANLTATPAANVTTTPEVNATGTPNASPTLPQTGGTFETSVLPILIGLLLLGAGLILFRMRIQMRSEK